MSATVAQVSAAMVEQALGACSEVRPEGAWRWSGSGQNGRRRRFTASFAEGFLHLLGEAAPLREAGQLQRALAAGGRGPVKPTLNRERSALVPRADLLAADAGQLRQRLLWALDGLQHAGEAPAAATADSTAADGGLSEALREAAWPATEVSGGGYVFDLGLAAAPPARLTAHGGEQAISVELARGAAPGEIASRALAVYLLSASRELRLVRAYAATAGGQWSCGFQAPLAAAPLAAELDAALAALTVAFQCCWRETEVLRDENAARQYLAVRSLTTLNDQAGKE
jgi:hypothetical protein